MFKRITLYLALLLLTSGPILGENRVWKSCDEDSDCGPNEICQKATDLDQPCLKGLCACRPCYDIYSWSDICTKPTYKTLDDPCDPFEKGIIYPPNAGCTRKGVVQCHQGWQDSFSPHFEKSCEKISAQLEESEDERICERNAECFGDLVCSNQFKCSCYFGHEKWDRRHKRCVKREFGDPCVIDDDCKVSGYNWQGFTYNSGACLDGYCGCSSDGRPAVVSYFEPGTSALKVKTICVDEDASVTVMKGETCTLDPIYNGDSHDAKVCMTALVCYQCPEQYEKNQSPICRSVIPSLTNVATCYPQRRTTTTTTTSTTTTTTTTTTPEETTAPETSAEDTTSSTASYKVVEIGGGATGDPPGAGVKYVTRASTRPRSRNCAVTVNSSRISLIVLIFVSFLSSIFFNTVERL